MRKILDDFTRLLFSSFKHGLMRSDADVKRAVIVIIGPLDSFTLSYTGHAVV